MSKEGLQDYSNIRAFSQDNYFRFNMHNIKGWADINIGILCLKNYR